MDLDVKPGDDSFFATKKKVTYHIGEKLRRYLVEHGRALDLPITYNKLFDSFESMPIIDSDGNDTLWETMLYKPEIMKELTYALTKKGKY